MSPSWPDLSGRTPFAGRAAVGLSPHQLSAFALDGRFRPRLSDRHLLPLPEQPPSVTVWDSGIGALDSLLAEPGWRGRDITVILSGHYVRHAVVPAGPGLSSDGLLSLAQIVFRDIFGELAGDWELRVSPPRSGEATLASGVPRALLASLETVCEAHGKLRSVQPCLMAVFNHVRRAIGSSSASLALVEAGRVTLASVDHGQWLYVDSRAGGSNVLPQLLLEEGELYERKPGGILWLCDLTGSVFLPPDTYWSQHRIEPPKIGGVVPGEGSEAGLAMNLALWGTS